nr:4'-phosphopantetheinyl transferase HetI [Ipomoea batatas]
MRMQCTFYRKLFTCSPSLTPVQLPSPKETHLWYVKSNEVKSEALLKQYMEILSASEKENVLRLHGDEHRKAALLARALVRTTVARYQINSHVDPRSLKFRKNIHGKPEVEWQHSDHWVPPPLHFNISHTTSLIACGVTVDSPIGIDVEENRRTVKNNILNLARRYFSEHEYKVLCSIGDSQVQHQEFIKLWTLKEAYVKALGIGFSGAPFNTFTIRFKNSVGGSSHLSLNSDSKVDHTISFSRVEWRASYSIPESQSFPKNCQFVQPSVPTFFHETFFFSVLQSYIVHITFPIQTLMFYYYCPYVHFLRHMK